MAKPRTPAAPPAAGRTIKTAIIVDFMGGGGKTAEEEVQEHKARLTAWLLPDVPEFHEPYYPAEGKDGIQPGTELLIYDFGGLGPGSDLMERNARELLKWAEDHPNSLVVIVSNFTFTNLIEPEMQVQRLTLPNIVCDQSWEEPCPIPEWWLGHPPGEYDDSLPVPAAGIKVPGPRKRIFK